MDDKHVTATPSPEEEAHPSRFWFVFPVALFLVVALCVRVAILRTQPVDNRGKPAEGGKHVDDRLDVAWKRRIGQFQQMPEFRELLARSAPPEEPVQLIRALSTKGVARLSDDELLHRVALLTALVGRADVETCAAIFRDSPTAEQLHAAFLKLDPDTLDAWLDLAARGAMAELQRTEAPSVSETQTTDALSALVKTLPPDDGNRLSKVLEDVSQSSDAEACWAARTFYGKVSGIGEPYDRILARALVRG